MSGRAGASLHILGSRERPCPRYFPIASVLLLFLGVVAFSDNLFTDIGQASNRDPKFIVHGVFGLAWYVLLVMSWLKPLLGAGYTPPVDEMMFQLFFWGAWIGLFLSLAAFDVKTLRRIHPVTVAGAGIFALVTAISMTAASRL